MTATRVMVVEDEAIVALNLQEQLGRLGYLVVAVTATGEHTLKLLDEAQPDVVLMDINIQGAIDGIETAARIPKARSIPIIYLTAYSEEATIQRARETNPCGYLLKPFSERELHATIQMGLARGETERALRAREQIFRKFSTMASDWFWEQDDQFRFVWIAGGEGGSQTVTELYQPGRTRLELIGNSIDDTVRAAHLADLEAHRPFRNFEFEQLCSDGTIRHYSVNGDPILDAENRFTGYRGTGRDITEQVHREEMLQLARREAERANRAKSEFLASMSHEFRTPLNAILGFSEIIRDEVMGSIAPPVYREYGGYVHDAGGHLLNLINNVLDLSKMEAGRFDLHLEATRLAIIIDSCRSMIYGTAESAGVTLVTDIAADLPPVMVDPLRFKQIMLNLLSNAVKFTAVGGMVSILAERAADGGVIVTVADTGIGMTAEEIEIALMPFQQIDGVLSRRYQGTGLGLSLAKRMVELHDGRLDISSEPGVGTTIRVRLPQTLILM